MLLDEVLDDDREGIALSTLGLPADSPPLLSRIARSASRRTRRRSSLGLTPLRAWRIISPASSRASFNLVAG
jgi:hypothetical protein